MFTAAADYLILEKTEFHKALEKMLDEVRSLGAKWFNMCYWYSN